MLRKLSKRIYTAEATVTGGRQGHGRTSDGVLDLDVRLPAEMGGKGGGALAGVSGSTPAGRPSPRVFRSGSPRAAITGLP